MGAGHDEGGRQGGADEEEVVEDMDWEGLESEDTAEGSSSAMLALWCHLSML